VEAAYGCAAGSGPQSSSAIAMMSESGCTAPRRLADLEAIIVAGANAAGRGDTPHTEAGENARIAR
jgi:hypothetical protein